MANTYYTEAELETLLSKSPVVSRGSGLYADPQYRLAQILYKAQLAGIPDYQDIDNITGLRKYYSKGDTVAVVSRYGRTVLRVAISLYNTTPTFAQIVSAISAEGGWSDFVSNWLAYAVLELWFSFSTEVGEQVLAHGDDFAADWSLVGGFSVAGGKLVYAHNANPNTAEQVAKDFLVPGVASKWYKFDYTLSDYALVGNQPNILTGFASAAVSLSTVNGKHTAFFISAGTLPAAGTFYIGVADSVSGGFKMDEFKLTQLVPAFFATDPSTGLVVGNGVVMSVEGKQQMAYQMENAVRELRYSEIGTYGPNPVL